MSFPRLCQAKARIRYGNITRSTLTKTESNRLGMIMMKYSELKFLSDRKMIKPPESPGISFDSDLFKNVRGLLVKLD